MHGTNSNRYLLFHENKRVTEYVTFFIYKQVKNGDIWSLTSRHSPLLISKAFFRLATSA
jgi:hypothetical protein